ncbi:hypothetical protein J3F84DRAFT_272838 [Trichoderma pleuroticola]
MRHTSVRGERTEDRTANDIRRRGRIRKGESLSIGVLYMRLQTARREGLIPPGGTIRCPDEGMLCASCTCTSWYWHTEADIRQREDGADGLSIPSHDHDFSLIHVRCLVLPTNTVPATPDYPLSVNQSYCMAADLPNTPSTYRLVSLSTLQRGALNLDRVPRWLISPPRSIRLHRSLGRAPSTAIEITITIYHGLIMILPSVNSTDGTRQNQQGTGPSVLSTRISERLVRFLG